MLRSGGEGCSPGHLERAESRKGQTMAAKAAKKKAVKTAPKKAVKKATKKKATKKK